MTSTASAVPRPRLPRRVLIANRGEIAVRTARTCRSMGIATVAVFSDADADALHVEVCDQAVRIGGAAAADSYLRGDRIVEAALRTGADAVHPGFGFLAEQAGFASAVREAGLLWIGPSPEVIAAMGDKLEAKRRIAAAGVPLLAGVELTSTTDDAELAIFAADVGYPLMVKAAAGGGGKGMRVVHHLDDLRDAVAAARREAESAFGDDRVFLERYVVRSRHVEVQVLGDTHGQVVHLFERECSIQRRHQKVVEEAPSPGIDAGVREALCAVAVDAARAIGYVNAGTVEFIVDDTVLARRRAGEDLDPREALAFLEMNTRLQVEHPVTEAVVRVRDTDTGSSTPIDLVRLQLLVAGGYPLPFGQSDLVQAGHAVEARLYAEDPAAGYLPATGVLHAFEPATDGGVRWDSGVRTGDVVGPHYDPMLAKVVASAPTRSEAASLLARALDASVIQGVVTNRDLLVAVLRDDAFLTGDTTTAFLDERFPDPADRRPTLRDEDVEVALIAAALSGAIGNRARAEVLTSLPSGFSNTRGLEPSTTFEVDGRRLTVRHRLGRDGLWRVRVLAGVPAGFLAGDADVLAERTVGVHAASERHLDVEVDGLRQRVETATDGRGAWQVRTGSARVELREEPRFPLSEREEVAGAALAPMPGAVAMIAVGEGAQVERGDLLVTVEAMKMEHRVTATVAGTVVQVRVVVGEQVEAGQALVVVEAVLSEGGPD